MKSYKLTYFIDENHDDLSGKVTEFLTYQLFFNKRKYIYFKEIMKAFQEVPPSVLLNVIIFICNNSGEFDLGFSKKYNDYFIRKNIPSNNIILVEAENE